MADKRILYFGLEPPPELVEKNVTHCPLIRIAAIPYDEPSVAMAFSKINDYTHLLFTSRSGAEIFFSHAKKLDIPHETLEAKQVVTVGNRTAEKVSAFLSQKAIVAKEQTAEGVCGLLNCLDLKNAYLFWPRSALARPVIGNWLAEHRIRHASCPFYTTHSIILPSPPPLDKHDEIIFTSPSTIDAFILNYTSLPATIPITCIGPVTQAYLEKFL